ncbi:hypothetical protein R3P38DRAFT_2821128 [Favolaschia claudopus]|uniref:Uncharacterized protein n=1 Tax=Favolaschia claudopus TaxID=2862362 RepID=A0AAW0EE59_9AGAR
MSSMNRNNPSTPLQNDENAYARYPGPTVPRQAHPGPSRQQQQADPRVDLHQRQQQQQQAQALQRQRSRPDQQYPPSRPDQPYPNQPGRPPLQRQPSRPDAQPLQRQPSRPDQPSQDRPLMRAPSAPRSAHSAPSTYDSQSTFSMPRPPYADSIIRGNSDDELDKTDAFWRRFNASAAQQQLPDSEKNSWLQKTEGKRSAHSRILWFMGVVFVILAVGGIGIGVYLSFHTANNQRPSTIGGAEDITSAGAAAATIGGGGGGGGGDLTSSSLHVTPTHTIDDR